MTDSELRKLIPAMPWNDGEYIYSEMQMDAHAIATARAVWAAAVEEVAVHFDTIGRIGVAAAVRSLKDSHYD